MSRKRTTQSQPPRRPPRPVQAPPSQRRSIAPARRDRWPGRAVYAIAGVLLAVVVIGVGWSIVSGGSGSTAGTVVHGRGGQWTNISANTLASMLTHKDFTLVDVKTPYVGEIDGTDLYIPYTDLVARKAELPADKGARIVVYCRSGAESAIAAQALLDLGYTNVLNLDGGMNAWTASGRRIVQKQRS